MSRPTFLPVRLAAAMLAGTMLLTGCHMGGTKQPLSQAQTSQFDVILQSYKDGQFLLDGAVLSSIDLGSHFSYLKDQGKLPKKVLLEPSDDSGIRKIHLQYMARMELTFGFPVFYDDKGQLVQISPVNTKARDLEDHHERAPIENSAPPPQNHTGGAGV